MTGPALTLTPWQRDELAWYGDGQPHRAPERPNSNLVRRDLLRRATEAGPGCYRITAAGLAALEATP